MHEWHTNSSKNILNLINEFSGFVYDTDYAGTQRTKGVKISSKIFQTEEETASYTTKNSYYSDYAYLAACATKKLSKGYQDAFTDFIKKYNEYLALKDNLTIAYGRKSSKATCPNCGSSISLKYGGKFQACPVCGSSKIISDSNWKTLDTKKRMMQKAAENLSKEAIKNDVTFVCSKEWHC